jgi:hypothetical protein
MGNAFIALGDKFVDSCVVFRRGHGSGTGPTVVGYLDLQLKVPLIFGLDRGAITNKTPLAAWQIIGARRVCSLYFATLGTITIFIPLIGK